MNFSLAQVQYFFTIVQVLFWNDNAYFLSNMLETEHLPVYFMGTTIKSLSWVSEEILIHKFLDLRFLDQRVNFFQSYFLYLSVLASFMF